MKPIFLLLLLSHTLCCVAQNEDYYGPVKISFHGFICNRPTNDDAFGMDGVSDEVSVLFWERTFLTTNRVNYSGLMKIYGENFLLPDRVKAGTATINGGIKAGDSYYREAVYGDADLNIFSSYDIVNTFCSHGTLITILPGIFERDNGNLGVTPIQDFGVVARSALNDAVIQNQVSDFSDGYTYSDSNPYGFILPGRHIGLDAKFAGMFTANKNKLASRPIGLHSNWDYSSQLIVLTPKTIKTIAEKDFGYGKGIIPVMYNEETMGNTEGHGNYIILLKIIADIKDRNAGNPPANLRTISVKVSNINPGEEYKFRLWTFGRYDTVTIKHPQTTINFPEKIAHGQQYNVVQTAGPRTCQLNNAVGAVSSNDITVTANCAAQVTNQKIGVKINAVGSDESFEFSAGGSRKITITQGNSIAYFPGTFRSGDNYTVTQTAGPRTCELKFSTGQVGREDIIVEAGCGEVKEKMQLHGKLTAPKGTTIIVALNGTEKLTVKQLKESPDGLGTTPFNFPKAYTAGSDYKVTILPSPGSTGCFIYENGEGKIGDSTMIGIRADKRYDLVSRSSDNKILNSYYETNTPVIGGKHEDEGRYVAFVTPGKGMDGSDGKFRQIFWRDRKNGVTKLISKAANGERGNGDSYAPAISADGRSVAFESYATNFGEEDNNTTRDIYVWSEGSGRVTLVSRSQFGGTANGESSEPTISGDGSVIAYTSYASNIVTLGSVFSTPNVYVYNQGNSDVITKDFKTGTAAGGYAPSIAEDGNKIAFCAYTGRLVENDNNNLWDIFLWQNGIPGLKRISFTSSGAERNQGTESASRVIWPAISGDGRFVAYATTASNMVAGDNNAMQDIFICSTTGGDVRRISEVAGGDSNGDSPISQGERVGISYDGSWITYNTNADNMGVPKGNIVLQNTHSGKMIPVTAFTNGSSARPMLSRNGAYVIAGCSERYDTRFSSSGIFVFYPHN